MTVAGIVVYPGADELDVVGPYRVLTAAAMPVHLVAERLEPLTLGEGLVIQPTHTYDDAPHLDVLVVPGGSSDSDKAGVGVERRNPRTIGYVTEASKAAEVTASVCTGAALLAEAGLLAGRRANTHWAFRDMLRELMAERGEPLEIVTERVVWDGDLVTAGGVTSGIDLALSLVERLLGEDRRRLVEVGLEMETPGDSLTV